MKRSLVLGLLLALLLLIPGVPGSPAAPAWAMVPEANNPNATGSVLVFHRFVTGKFGKKPKSSFRITVGCPDGVTCNPPPNQERVHLRAAWICPGTGPNNSCPSNGFNVHRTAAGVAVGAQVKFTPGSRVKPLCPKGFLLVWAIDEFGQPIKFDGLTGVGLLRESASQSEPYTALPIQAITAKTHREVLDGSAKPVLRFDGLTSYRAVTDTVSGAVEYNDPPTVITKMSVLTLDVILGSINAETALSLEFFDENAVSVLSVDTAFTCWAEFDLMQLFTSPTPTPFPTAPGTVQGNAGATLLGIVHTRQKASGSGPVTDVRLNVLVNDGAPVSTTLEPQ